MGGGHALGTESSDNMVVGREDYEAVTQRTDTLDDATAEALHGVTRRIGEMCVTVHVLPAATPRILAVSDRAGSSLSEYRAHTEKMRAAAGNHADAVMRIGT